MGGQAKHEVAPPPKRIREATFFAPGATSMFACALIVLLNDAALLQMTRLLQITNTSFFISAGCLLVVLFGSLCRCIWTWFLNVRCISLAHALADLVVVFLLMDDLLLADLVFIFLKWTSCCFFVFLLFGFFSTNRSKWWSRTTGGPPEH